MNSGLYTAFSGMNVQHHALNVIANNLANANTIGYKEDRDFSRLFNNAIAYVQDPISGAINNAVISEGIRIDYSPGNLVQTGNDLDLALAGDGFFVVQTQAGERYTRNGSFTINSARQLVTREGFPVLGDKGPITLSAGKVEIDQQGRIAVNGTPAGRLRIVDFTSRAGLRKQGNSLFVHEDANVQPVEVTSPDVRQGYIEKANVDPIKLTVQMIEILRRFEFLEKSVEALMNDMNLRVIDQMGRI